MFFKRDKQPAAAYASPHSLSKKLNETEKVNTREQVESTRHDLNVLLESASSNVQKAIRNIRRIDNTPPVDKRARKNAMRMLRMYIGQHRVVQAMSDNIEMVYSELTIREMTTEFSQSMTKISGLIQQYSRQAIGPGKLVRQMRDVLRPTQSVDVLREYDRMYDELALIYGTEEASDPTGISDAWLEQVIAGDVAWDSSSLSGNPEEDEDEDEEYIANPDSVPLTEAAAPVYTAPAQPAPQANANASQQDILQTLAAIRESLKD